MNETLVRSRHITAFAHMGAVYLFHDLYGYILEMSPDVLAFVHEFENQASPTTVCSRFEGRFGEQSPSEFVDVFCQFACLLEPDAEEIDGIWAKVPVKSKWLVWERNADDCVEILAGFGDRSVVRHALSSAETALWDRMDGETSLVRLADEFDSELIAGLVQRLVHHDVQALKLSGVPLSVYGARKGLIPSYITSTMPYGLYTGEDDLAASALGTSVTTTDYHKEQIDDANAQFEDVETTLSHLLREPHPALAGRTYGRALVDALAARDMLGKDMRVLEIGGGLGYVAEAVIDALVEREALASYQIVELSPALASAQRTRLKGKPVTIATGDALSIELEPGSFDLIIANEMVGDLPALEVDKKTLEGSETAALIEELGLNVEDAPDTFYLNTGAIALSKRIFQWLAPGGRAIITEFGERARYPQVSTHLDHPEMSIHFGHLETASKTFGFETDFEFIIDLLEMKRDCEGLATTRSYFKALRELLKGHGVALAKIGHTRETFEQLIAGVVDKERIGELYFDRIEDRLMGLVPHEFKALLLRKNT